jgi:cell division protein FtsI (penicillin-binding protein 3)
MMFALLPGEKPELILMVVARQPYLDPVPATAKQGLDLTSPLVKILPAMVALQQVHKHLSDMRSVVARKESNYQQAHRRINLSGLETMLDQQHLVMPDLAGMSLRRALCLLQDKKIKVRIQGTGRVVSQVPAAGMSLDNVKECRVTLKKDEKAVSEISKVSAKKQVKTEVIKKASK